jgi:hypothetical protein
MSGWVILALQVKQVRRYHSFMGPLNPYPCQGGWYWHYKYSRWEEIILLWAHLTPTYVRVGDTDSTSIQQMRRYHCVDGAAEPILWIHPKDFFSFWFWSTNYFDHIRILFSLLQMSDLRFFTIILFIKRQCLCGSESVSPNSNFHFGYGSGQNYRIRVRIHNTARNPTHDWVASAWVGDFDISPTPIRFLNAGSVDALYFYTYRTVGDLKGF